MSDDDEGVQLTATIPSADLITAQSNGFGPLEITRSVVTAVFWLTIDGFNLLKHVPRSWLLQQKLDRR
jgi:hypothetical protein